MNADEIDQTILAAKRFLNAYSPPKEDKVKDFLSFAKRKFSELATFFLAEKGIDISGTMGGKNRTP